MELIQLMRICYLIPAFAILFVYAVPALRWRFLAYGPRSAWPTNSQRTPMENQPKKASVFSSLLDAIAKVRVPHSWFTSFYVVGVGSSILWAGEIFRNGARINPIDQAPTPPGSMTIDQIVVAWTLVFVQCARRAYECLYQSHPSESEMWFGHWALGILFYASLPLAAFIEGIPTLQVQRLTFGSVTVKGPSLRTFVAVMAFILASGFQNDVHAYLSSLKSQKPSEDEKKPSDDKKVSKYRLPEHEAFNLCLTPHYFAECVIYLVLAVQATPKGTWINGTLACALLFVVVNLGVTAQETKIWYQEKFGLQSVKGRSKMIPGVF